MAQILQQFGGRLNVICNSHKNSKLLGFQIVKIGQTACKQSQKTAIWTAKFFGGYSPRWRSRGRQNLICNSHGNSKLMSFLIIKIDLMACPQRPKNWDLISQILEAATKMKKKIATKIPCCSVFESSKLVKRQCSKNCNLYQIWSLYL